MQTSGQHELNFGHPLLDGVRLGLRVFVILLEVVGEVAVEIEAHRVVAPLAAVAGAFARHLETVRVHRGQNVDAGVVQQPPDVRVGFVASHQILRTQNRI